jgi:hypothetical protein
MRAFAETAYGLPPKQAIGSSGKAGFDTDGDKARLFKLPELGSVDDGPGKPPKHRPAHRPPPARRGRQLRRRPPHAAVRRRGALPALAMLVHHGDAAREHAYDRASKIGTLGEATRRGWPLNSMRRDWKQVFPTPTLR